MAKRFVNKTMYCKDQFLLGQLDESKIVLVKLMNKLLLNLTTFVYYKIFKFVLQPFESSGTIKIAILEMFAFSFLFIKKAD